MARAWICLIVALTACGGEAAEGVAPATTQVGEIAPAPPPPAPVTPTAPPPAPGLRAELDGSTLIVRDGALEARMPVEASAAIATVDLAEGGAERGIWIGAGGSSSILRLRGDGTLEALHGGMVGTVSHGIAGSVSTSSRLLDLDGDGVFELILERTRFDDTGGHARSEVLARSAGGGPFEPRRDLRAPARSMLFTGGGTAISRALRAAAGAPMSELAIASLGEPTWIRGPAPDPGTIGGGRASPPAIGSLVAVLAYSGRADAASLPLSLFVVRAWPQPAEVLASQPVGELREAFADEACRVRVRTGPQLRVARQDGDGSDVLVTTIATGEARTARAFRWRAGALTAHGEPLELDRCESAAHDVVLTTSPDGSPVLTRAPLPDGARSLW